ncbi:MAG: response regulator [Bacteriovorax sp.]
MKILIVDDEREVAEIIDFLVKEYFPGSITTMLSKSGNSAINILRTNPSIDLCICDHNMPDGLGSEVLKFIVQNKLNTKFVLCSSIVPDDRPDDYTLIFSNIQKPHIGAGIENLSKLVESHGMIKNKFSVQDFIPISVFLLAIIGKAPTDIFIRMSGNKFIKCINRSDEFTESDRDKYVSKAIPELYLKRGDQDCIKELIFSTTKKILERRNMPLEDKMSIVHAQITSMIKKMGMTPELAEATKQSIEKSITLMRKNPLISEFWKEINLLGEYPSRLYTLHSMLAGLALEKLQMDSDSNMFRLILSSFLQDITLNSISLMEICDYKEFMEKQSQGFFTPLEVENFKNHPQKAAELVLKINDIPPDVLRTIIEQHEMPDGSGIPSRLKASQIHPVSCIFIVTGIFARHLLKLGDSFDFREFIIYLEKRGYSEGNFKDALEALKSMQKSVVY